jgi:hypothetical protein
VTRTPPAHRRVLRLRSGAVVLALTATLGAGSLTACETKSGVAGFVGSTPIATSALSGFVERGAQAASQAQANVSRTEIQQFWLSTLIERDLARRVAQQQGITISPTDPNVFLSQYAPFNGGLDQLRRSAAEIGISSGDLPVLFEAWTYEDRIADKVAPQLLAPDSAAQQAYTQLRAQYPGQTYQQLAPTLRRLIVFDQRRSAVLPVLQDEARRTRVRINPRFGTWDLSRLTIGAPPTDLARPAAPSAAPPVSGGAGDNTAPAPAPAP